MGNWLWLESMREHLPELSEGFWDITLARELQRNAAEMASGDLGSAMAPWANGRSPECSHCSENSFMLSYSAKHFSYMETEDAVIGQSKKNLK